MITVGGVVFGAALVVIGCLELEAVGAAEVLEEGGGADTEVVGGGGATTAGACVGWYKVGTEG